MKRLREEIAAHPKSPDGWLVLSQFLTVNERDALPLAERLALYIVEGSKDGLIDELLEG